MHIADPSFRAQPWHVGHDEAVHIAMEAADRNWVAETVYLTSNGFAVLDATSPLLRDRGVTVTLLPSRYFS